MGTQEKCVIISSGDCMTTDVSELVRDALVICADGGIHNAQRMGIRADVLIGDGDSMHETFGVKYNTFIQLPTEKDVTDTMACVSYGLEQGCKVFYLLCCTGGRLDHLISNIFILEYLNNRGYYGAIYDDFNEISFASSGVHIRESSDKFKYLSVIALDESVSGVTLEGVKYPLENHTLHREFALGVSNEITRPYATITIGSGRCLLIRSRDRS